MHITTFFQLQDEARRNYGDQEPEETDYNGIGDIHELDGVIDDMQRQK